MSEVGEKTLAWGLFGILLVAESEVTPCGKSEGVGRGRPFGNGQLMTVYVKGFRMPASHCARGCTEAGVRKASKEETAGEYAPAAVSVYGDLSRGSAGLGCSRT